jgi:hypothetical protein
MLIKKPIIKLSAKETRLGVEAKSQKKAKQPTEKEKAIMLETIKDINKLKIKRNKLPKNSVKRELIQAGISAMEDYYRTICKKYTGKCDF